MKLDTTLTIPADDGTIWRVTGRRFGPFLIHEAVTCGCEECGPGTMGWSVTHRDTRYTMPGAFDAEEDALEAVRALSAIPGATALGVSGFDHFLRANEGAVRAAMAAAMPHDELPARPATRPRPFERTVPRPSIRRLAS